MAGSLEVFVFIIHHVYDALVHVCGIFGECMVGKRLNSSWVEITKIYATNMHYLIIFRIVQVGYLLAFGVQYNGILDWNSASRTEL